MISYILPKDMEREVPARLVYLRAVFHTEFSQVPDDRDYTRLVSYLPTAENYLFLCGHNTAVEEYLRRHRGEAEGSVVVITSCTPVRMLFLLPWLRNVYFSKTRGIYTLTRHGAAFGFDFEITDSELHLLNTREFRLIDRIGKAYWKAA